MATTTFVNGVTLTDSGWFNDADAAVYEGTFPSGITALSFTGATTLTAFAGATTKLTLGGTGASAVVALPGTLEASGTTGAFTVAGGAYIAKKLNVVGDVTLTGDIAVNGGDITTTATTLNIAAATATTVNAFGAASTALNIGHASAAAAFPGGVSIPTGKTLSGAGAVAMTGAITSAAQKSSMWLDTLATTPTSLAVNQHGTVSTAVVYFTRALVDTGTDFTHSSAETLGSKITINRAGLYAITAQFRDGGSGNTLAITKNATETTSAPTSGGDGQNLASAILAAGAGAARQSISLSTVAFLAVNDVIRLHQIGATDSDSQSFNFLRIDAIL